MAKLVETATTLEWEAPYDAKAMKIYRAAGGRWDADRRVWVFEKNAVMADGTGDVRYQGGYGVDGLESLRWQLDRRFEYEFVPFVPATPETETTATVETPAEAAEVVQPERPANALRAAMAADKHGSASVQDGEGNVWTFGNELVRGSAYASPRTPYLLRKNNRVEDRFASIEEFERVAGQDDIPAVDADWQTTYR